MDLYSREYAFKFLLLISVLFILFIGLRGETGADSYTYISFFDNQTTTVWNWQVIERGYAEFGFYYLSVLLKSVSSNVNIYFTGISFLTFVFLILSIKRFGMYPLLGFCVYYARFLFFRDMNQIRAALAIVVVIYALSFLVKHEKKKYCCLVLCAASLHYSVFIALFFCFMYDNKFSIAGILKILITSALIGILSGVLLKKILISTGFGIFRTYVDTNDLGLTNPVIVFQVTLCILFFFFEGKLCNKQYGYYVLRNAYLFSTVILLLASNLGVIGARLSTQFATCEIFIVPAIISIIRPRISGYFLVIALLLFVFYLNYSKMLLSGFWIYNLNI